MDRLRTIECFLASAELGSFSRAARSLGITPASVSRQIGLLEDRLGTRLFNRTTRHLSLTEGGALFRERVCGLVEGLSEAEDIVRDLSGAPAGLLRITAPASFGRLHIAPWLPSFLDRYPQIKLDLFFTDRLVDVLEERIDVAIRITDAQDSSTICRKLARQNSVVCASPAYLDRHGAPKRFGDLQAHNCLTYSAQITSRWRLYRRGEEIDHLDVSGNMRARDGDTIYVATLYGLGLSLQPLWRVGDDLKVGKLINVFPEYAVSSIGAATGIHAFYNHREYLAPKVKVLVDYLIEIYGSPPYWENGFPSVT